MAHFHDGVILPWRTWGKENEPFSRQLPGLFTLSVPPLTTTLRRIDQLNTWQGFPLESHLRKIYTTSAKEILLA